MVISTFPLAPSITVVVNEGAFTSPSCETIKPSRFVPSPIGIPAPKSPIPTIKIGYVPLVPPAVV